MILRIKVVGTPLFTPLQQQVRHRGKLNIKRPDPGPWERRMLLELTKPLIYDDMVKDSARCASERRKEESIANEVNPYEEFLVRQCKKMFNEMRMILAYQVLPTRGEEVTLLRNTLYKKGLDLYNFNNNVMRRAVSGTKFINMSPLFYGHTSYVVSTQPLLSEAIKITRKTPTFLLLGGLVDNTLFSRVALLERSKLPNIDILRGELVSLLNTPAMRTRSNINSHVQSLSTNLQQYVEGNHDSSST